MNLMTLIFYLSMALCLGACVMIFVFIASVHLRWLPRWSLAAISFGSGFTAAGAVVHAGTSKHLSASLEAWYASSGFLWMALAVGGLVVAWHVHRRWPHPQSRHRSAGCRRRRYAHEPR